VFAFIAYEGLFQQQLSINIALDKIELESYQDGYKTTADLDLQLARRDNEKLGHTDYSHAFIKINKVLYDQNVEINQNAATGVAPTKLWRWAKIFSCRVLPSKSVKSTLDSTSTSKFKKCCLK
jgi:hypothetical protein